MIERPDIFNIRFYDKSWFHGSYQGMRYRIEKIVVDDEKKLKATTWPGPYAFDYTDDSLKVSEVFPYGNEGLDLVCEYLNKFYEEHAEQFKQ